MFISSCLAYTDIIAECRQQNGSFVITVRTQRGIDISLILNYTQIKGLAEGLLATANQALIQELAETNISHVLGEIHLRLDQSQVEEKDQQKGVEPQCQPDISPVPMAEQHLSKIA